MQALAEDMPHSFNAMIFHVLGILHTETEEILNNFTVEQAIKYVTER